MMKRVLSTLLAALSIISCGSLQNTKYNMPPTTSSSRFELGSSKRFNGKVFQTINNHEALVELISSSYDRTLVYVVTPSSSKEYLFDQLSINGEFIFIGTHKYKTVNRDFDQYKTVPVFIEKRYYIKGMEWNDWYERIDTPEVTEI